jgi:hypothetical protein
MAFISKAASMLELSSTMLALSVVCPRDRPAVSNASNRGRIMYLKLNYKPPLSAIDFSSFAYNNPQSHLLLYKLLSSNVRRKTSGGFFNIDWNREKRR